MMVMKPSRDTLQSSKRFSQAAELEISLIRFSINLNGYVKTTFNLKIPLKYLTFSLLGCSLPESLSFYLKLLFN